jgi:hypothetical protein
VRALASFTATFMATLWVIMGAPCAVLLALLAAPLHAQGLTGEENEPAWYRVEIIVFRYLETDAESEIWPALPDLAYPPRLRHLRAGMADSDLQQDFQLLRIEDTVPAPAFDLAWEKSTTQLLREYYDSLDALGVAGPLPILEGVSAAPEDTNTGSVSVIEPLSMTVPRAFTPLDVDATEFSAEALRIRRSRDKRLLFHQSWLQPLRAREHSLPIAVDSTIMHEDYPALQGSLMLYVSRYLHIETNLWLNTGNPEQAAVVAPVTTASEPVDISTDTAVGGSLGAPLAVAAWSMPPPPLPPKPYSWTPWSFQVELETGFSDDIVLPPEVIEEITGAATAGTTDSTRNLPIVAGLDPADELQPVLITAQRITVLDIEQFLKQTWYPFDHAVLVQQKRRMRGGELHYLDHPLLGVILRVSPYEFEAFLPAPELTSEIAGNSPGSRR